MSFLQFLKTHECEYKCNYLDLSLEANNNKIETNLFNKTDSFNFMVIRFPNAESKVSIKIKINAICTETLRISNTCSKFE